MGGVIIYLEVGYRNHGGVHRNFDDFSEEEFCMTNGSQHPFCQKMSI